jgi:hypothetical protein
MTETQARSGLRRMLRTLTVGSLLHLLAELYHEAADRGKDRSDHNAQEVAATLFVVGIGIDAVCPRPLQS